MPDKTIEPEMCPLCGNRVTSNSFETICNSCGFVISNFFQESSYIFNDANNKSNLDEQYDALGERSDYIGGLGTFIDNENSKHLKDKTGRILPPDEQKLFRRLKCISE